MKRLLGVLALLLVGGLVVWQTSTQIADAQRTFTAQVDVLKDATEGYATVSCSMYVNYDTGGYMAITPATDYEIHRFDFIAVKPNAAQVCSLLVWTSATDSTNLLHDPNWGTAHCTPINLASGANDQMSFPIKCSKISIKNIAATDDFMLLVYYKVD